MRGSHHRSKWSFAADRLSESVSSVLRLMVTRCATVWTYRGSPGFGRDGTDNCAIPLLQGDGETLRSVRAST